MIHLPMIVQANYKNQRVYFCTDASNGGLPYWGVTFQNAHHFYLADDAEIQLKNSGILPRVVHVELMQLEMNPNPVATFSAVDTLQDAVDCAWDWINEINTELKDVTDTEKHSELLAKMLEAQNAYRKALEAQAQYRKAMGA